MQSGMTANNAAASRPGAPPKLGPNDRVPLAIIGLGGRGRDHMQFYASLPQAEIAAVCDLDQSAQERAVALVEKLTGKKPRVFSDMRKVFDDPGILAVSMATPNHWHALSTIWACQAGKDVYVEKPASHNIWEGRQMVAAARKYGRMVQVGSQSRTTAHKQKAIALLQQGVLGKVYAVRGLCYRRRQSIGRKPDAPVPPGLNWDAFLGPAPLRPFNPLRFAYNWHWFWDTGNGDIGNQGVHELDICLWALGRNELPRTVVSTGGKYLWDDLQETPNMQQAHFDFGDVKVDFEVRNLLTVDEAVPRAGASTVGNIIFGADGYMVLDFAGFRIYQGERHELVREEKLSEAKAWDTAPHMDNFLNAVKSRRYQDLTADIATGTRAAAMAHLANISYRLGRRVTFDEATMKFAADTEANALLSRNYRRPYVVPEKV